LERKAALGILALPKNLKVAAVGPKTASRLQRQGVSPDFVPQDYVAEAIVSGLGDLRARWVLLPAADIAQDALPQAIRNADGIAHVITAYHTVAAEPGEHGLAALRAGLDWITFTSGSTVRSFVALAQRAGFDPLALPGDPRVACIGPRTARAAQELGFKVDAVAKTYTVDGLIQAIQTHSGRTRPS
jgi:uroporphyrinogen III methyltransferase/synthase